MSKDRRVGSGLNILVVDDIEVNRLILSQMLREQDHAVALATGGEEALHYVETNEFDLVFMDLRMPGMDGLQTTKAIRGFDDPQKGSIPIYIVTADVTDAQRRECLENGVTGFVAKPFRKADLAAVLTEVGQEEPVPDADGLEEDPDQDPVLDMTAIDAVLKAMPEDRARMLLGAFKRTSLNLLQEMEEAVSEDDLEKLRKAFHAMKGSSSSLGLLRLTRYCAAAEQSCADGDTHGVYTRFDRLPSLVGEADEAITSVMQTIS